MNLLTSVELHQCGQCELIITVITEHMAVLLGEDLCARAYFSTFSCLAHTLDCIVITSVIINIFLFQVLKLSIVQL